MAKANYLQDKDGNKFYPYAHADASYDRNGVTVGKRLDDLEGNVKNIFTIDVPNIWQDNKYVKITGGIANYTGWKASDWIEIPENATKIYIECTDTTDDNKPYNEFWTDKDFVSFATLNEWNVIPHGVNWLRLSCPMSASVVNIKYTTDNIEIIDLNRDIENTMIQSTSKRRNQISQNDKKPLSFIHFTDIHGKEALWERLVEYSNYYSDMFDFILHTGDWVESSQTTYNDMFNTSPVNKNTLLNVIGNHDSWAEYTGDSSSIVVAPIASTYDYCVEKMTRSYQPWGVTFMDSNKCTAWYKDFVASNIRLIAIDLFYNLEEQKTWLANLLQDAINNNIHVITTMHQKTGQIITKITNFNSVDDYGIEASLGIEKTIATAINNGLIYIGNFAGHDHFDECGFTESGVFNFVSECATDNITWQSNKRKLDTKTQDCFNVISIDTTQGHLKITRIGDNSDRYMNVKNSYCYDYINKKIINENDSPDMLKQLFGKVEQQYWEAEGSNSWTGSLLLSGHNRGNKDDYTAVTYRNEILTGNPIVGQLFVNKNSIYTDENGMEIHPSIAINDSDAYWTSQQGDETIEHTSVAVVKMDMNTKGTEDINGESYISIGNNIKEGTKGNSKGGLYIFGKGIHWTGINADDLITSNVSLTLPNKSGTLALTSDIPIID